MAIMDIAITPNTPPITFPVFLKSDWTYIFQSRKQVLISWKEYNNRVTSDIPKSSGNQRPVAAPPNKAVETNPYAKRGLVNLATPLGLLPSTHRIIRIPTESRTSKAIKPKANSAKRRPIFSVKYFPKAHSPASIVLDEGVADRTDLNRQIYPTLNTKRGNNILFISLVIHGYDSKQNWLCNWQTTLPTK